MGSFNATCIVSNLPIEAGDKVRYLLLTRSRYTEGNDHVCYVGGRWQLRSAAFKAEYNDYGSIENLEDSLVTRAAFEALNRDAVEKGVGDNQCHDVHVRSGMSVDEWLEALWEGRVYVQDTVFRFKYPDGTYKAPEPEIGIPTLSRLEAILKSRGVPVVTAYGAKGCTLDELSSRFIRIRGGDFGKELSYLEKVVPAIQRAGYAAMVTCGTGSYHNHAEILVAPRPAPEGKHFFSDGVRDEPSRVDREIPRPVSQAMVREDVWQILLGTPIQSWSGNYTFEVLKKDAISAAKTAKESAATLADLQAEAKALKETAGDNEKAIMAAELAALRAEIAAMTDDRIRYAIGGGDKNLFLQSLMPGEGSSGFGLRAAFELGLELSKTEEELEAYVVALAETIYVQWVYSSLHGQWHPTTNSGQDGNWKAHREFLTKLTAIKDKWEDEQDEDEQDEEQVEEQVDGKR